MSLIVLATAKEFLQISHTKEDTALQIMLDAVEEWVAEYCGLRFNATAAAASIEEEYCNGGGLNLWPKYHPILDVTEVGNYHTKAVYTLANVRWNKARIWKSDETHWIEGMENWWVDYEAGYTASTLPSGLKLAIFDMLYLVYNARGGKTSESVMGHSRNWAGLFDSAITDRLRAFGFRANFS